jgi:hypothetical protein
MPPYPVVSSTSFQQDMCLSSVLHLRQRNSYSNCFRARVCTVVCLFMVGAERSHQLKAHGGFLVPLRPEIVSR